MLLGTHIQKLRQEKKMTLSRLAEKTEISKSYLSTIERNIQTNPSIEILSKIASALQVDIQTLLNPNSVNLESAMQTKVPERNWSNLIDTAIEAGVINEKDLHDISLAIQKGKRKP